MRDGRVVFLVKKNTICVFSNGAGSLPPARWPTLAAWASGDPSETGARPPEWLGSGAEWQVTPILERITFIISSIICGIQFLVLRLVIFNFILLHPARENIDMFHFKWRFLLWCRIA